MTSLFLRNLDEHQQLMAGLHALAPAVQSAGERLAAILEAGGKLMFCGNGGSAADSQHLASELTGRFIKDRRPLAGLALSTDSSALSCIGNDYAFEQVFARQLQALGRPGDALVAISTSGNSPNVVRALEAARGRGLVTMGFAGQAGGKMVALCDHVLKAPSTWTPVIQQIHITAAHIVCALVERAMFPELAPAVSGS